MTVWSKDWAPHPNTMIDSLEHRRTPLGHLDQPPMTWARLFSFLLLASSLPCVGCLHLYFWNNDRGLLVTTANDSADCVQLRAMGSLHIAIDCGRGFLEKIYMAGLFANPPLLVCGLQGYQNPSIKHVFRSLHSSDHLQNQPSYDIRLTRFRVTNASTRRGFLCVWRRSS
jgi:hypothetical protein